MIGRFRLEGNQLLATLLIATQFGDRGASSSPAGRARVVVPLGERTAAKRYMKTYSGFREGGVRKDPPADLSADGPGTNWSK